MLPLRATTRRATPGGIVQFSRNQESWRGIYKRFPISTISHVEKTFVSSGWWKESREHHRLFSIDGNHSVHEDGQNKIHNVIFNEEEQSGAWIILSALEKVKEAELMTIARLAASMPTTSKPDAVGGDETTGIASTKSSNSLFVSLEDVITRAKYSAGSFEGDPSEGLRGDDIRELLNATRQGMLIDLPTILALVEGVTIWNRKFRSKSKLVNLPPLSKEQSLTVIGDLHGSLSDLATVLEVMPGAEPHENNMLLFNGDLADRGDHGIETICIVCALCLAYPQFVYINRGNHEDLALSIAYGLMDELRIKYGRPEVPKCLTRALDAFFRSLPLATIVEEDALIVHGGPPPPKREERLSDLLASKEHRVLGGKGFSRTSVDSVGSVTPHIREEQEIIEALLWSDPLLDETGRLLEEHHDMHHVANTQSSTLCGEEETLGWHPNPSRGAGYMFDVGVVRRCLQKEGLNRMVRSHEQIQNGCSKYKIPTEESIFQQRGHRPSTGNTSLDIKPHMELFTVFSASKYPYKEGFNQGAVLELKANGQHKIRRYLTEDDDPVSMNAIIKKNPIDDSASHEGQYVNKGSMPITLEIIRENLFEAICHHEGAILQSLQLENATPTLSFDSILDILIQSFDMKGETINLRTNGAKIVLAKALGMTSTEDHIDLERFSIFIRKLSREHKTFSSNQQIQRSAPHIHNRHLEDTPVANVVSSKASAVEETYTKEIFRLLENNDETMDDESDSEDEVLEG